MEERPVVHLNVIVSDDGIPILSGVCVCSNSILASITIH